MPTLQELLDFAAQIRIGVKFHKPADLGLMAAHMANDFRNSDGDVRRIINVIADAVEEEYGAKGREQFYRRYNQIARR